MIKKWTTNDEQEGTTNNERGTMKPVPPMPIITPPLLET
jgi:hypothetical protein